MIPDPRWLDALKLPQKVIAGLFLFSLLLLAFDYFALVSLTDLSALARPVVIITALLFGSLSLTALVAVIHDIIAQRRKMTLLSKRRQIRREETDRAQAEFESQALARLNFLSKEEIRHRGAVAKEPAVIHSVGAQSTSEQSHGERARGESRRHPSSGLLSILLSRLRMGGPPATQGRVHREG
jgi:hypothetical protein